MAIRWQLTKGETKAFNAMPETGLVAATKGSVFNGGCMWRLYLKGYVVTPDAGASPTLYEKHPDWRGRKCSS